MANLLSSGGFLLRPSHSTNMQNAGLINIKGFGGWARRSPRGKRVVVR